ncbi:tripartite motif-containing protein 59-like protein [Aphelenchoides avenae]|nr:tripartite motif-containing protein 59-like protein [Aphelenchus avenae]
MEHVPDVAETLPECPVCLDMFEQPRILPACGHTLCGKCVAPLVTRTNNLPTAQCPLCKVVSALPQGGFPVNYALRAALSDLRERKACTSCRRLVAADAMIRCRTCEVVFAEPEVTVCVECFLSEHKGHNVAKPASGQQRFDEALCAVSNVENDVPRAFSPVAAEVRSAGVVRQRALESVVAGCKLIRASALNTAAHDIAKVHEFSVHVERMQSLRAILLDESTDKFWSEAEELRQRVASVRDEPLPELPGRHWFSRSKPFDALRDAVQLISGLSFNPTRSLVDHSAGAVSTSANASTGPAVVSRAATAMDHQIAGPSRGGALRFERTASTSTISDAGAGHALNITPVVFFCRQCGRGDHWTRHCGNRRRYCTTCRRVHSAPGSCRATATPRP